MYQNVNLGTYWCVLYRTCLYNIDNFSVNLKLFQIEILLRYENKEEKEEKEGRGRRGGGETAESSVLSFFFLPILRIRALRHRLHTA